MLHTIDVNPAHIAVCRRVLRDHLPRQSIDDLVRFHVGDGVEVLSALVPLLDRIDLLYVDGGTGGATAARHAPHVWIGVNDPCGPWWAMYCTRFESSRPNSG